MPRPERALDPAEGAVQGFAVGLRRLREEAGGPGYRELARRAHFSATTLSDAASGRRLPTLTVTLAYVQACGGDPGEWEARWRAIAAPSADTADPVSGDAGGERAPYLGLVAYQPQDAGWFFGRERLTGELTDRLACSRFLAVVGPSGVGKSSLLCAGLLGAVRGGKLSQGYRGQTVLMTPGAHPLTELAVHLGRLTGIAAGSLRADWVGDPARLHLSVRQALTSAPRQAQLLLVVDQFEEVFTLCQDSDERHVFLAGLLAAVRAKDSRVRVVLGIRSDAYPSCAQYPDLVAELADGQVLVGAMSAAQLREAITKPAERAGLMVEGALVSTIVAEVAGRPGALPLASHALWEAWRRRRGNAITLSGYEAAGGLTGALARIAEQIYTDLDCEQRRLTREVLLRMIEIGGDGEASLRRVQRSEFDNADPCTTVVLARLAGGRVLMLGEGTVEIAHEALLLGWPRLHDWVEEDREGLRTHRQLTHAAAIWASLDHDPGTLYRGLRLSNAVQWASHHPTCLTPQEQGFLNASRVQRTRDAAERGRRTRLSLTVVCAATMLVVVLAGLVLVQAHRAQAERDLAFSRQLVASARAQLPVDPELGLLLARQAYALNPSADADVVLRQATLDSRVRRVLTGHDAAVNAVAFSPDGRWLASGDAHGKVQAWDMTNDGRPQAMPGQYGFINDVTFSPDGRYLAATSLSGRIVWAGPDRGGLVIRHDEGHHSPDSTLAFSPDGRQLATGDYDGMVRIWKTASTRGLAAFNGQQGAIMSLAFSPDGRRLATAGEDGTVRTWDTAGWKASSVLRGHTGPVAGLAFSPDGKRLASVGNDGTLRIWDMSGVRSPLIVAAHDGGAACVAFSRDGRRVATGGSDQTVRIWDAANPVQPLVLHGHKGAVFDLAFSPDGQRLASASADKTVRLWDTGGVTDPVVLHGNSGSRLRRRSPHINRPPQRPSIRMASTCSARARTTPCGYGTQPAKANQSSSPGAPDRSLLWP
jgi:WD40 repeat protein